MSQQDFMVAPGRSLINPVGGRIFREKTKIDPSIYDPETFKDYIKTGFVVAYKEDVSEEDETARLLDSVDDVHTSPRRTSKWNLDPMTLVHKSLSELNVMIAERDPSVEPFDTPGEASAYLSQDF